MMESAFKHDKEVSLSMLLTGDSENGTKFGTVLRAYRRAAGLTQNELARAAGMSVAAVRDLEQGRRRFPRPSSISQLVSALGLDIPQARELGHAARDTSAMSGQRARRGTGAADRLRLRVLGPLTAWRGDTQLDLGPPRQRAVFGLLAVNPDTPVRREVMMDALWGGDVPPTATNLIQTYVARLRRLLEPNRSPRDRGGCLASVGSGYRLQAAEDQLDMLEFRHVVDEADAASARGRAAAYQLYEDALAMYGGDPLTDIDLLQGHPAVARLTSQRTAVITRYAKTAFEAGCHDRVLLELRALVAREPLNERAHALLMTALAGSGQQGVALQVYEDIRRRLDEQLGIYPGRELSAVHEKVLRQEVPVQRHHR